MTVPLIRFRMAFRYPAVFMRSKPCWQLLKREKKSWIGLLPESFPFQNLKRSHHVYPMKLFTHVSICLLMKNKENQNLKNSLFKNLCFDVVCKSISLCGHLLPAHSSTGMKSFKLGGPFQGQFQMSKCLFLHCGIIASLRWSSARSSFKFLFISHNDRKLRTSYSSICLMELIFPSLWNQFKV